MVEFVCESEMTKKDSAEGGASRKEADEELVIRDAHET